MRNPVARSGAAQNDAISPRYRDAMPLVIPAGWRRLSDIVFENEAGELNGNWYEDLTGLRVGLSVEKEQDGRWWVHLSVSHRDRLPKWKEFVMVKEIFIGRDRPAVQVLPERAKWVNIHPNVLHLFSPLDNDLPLPDFTRGKGTL